MSYLVSSFDHHPSSRHPQRLPMSPAPFHPSYPPHNHHIPSYPDHPPVSLPKVGQTRCYWALLSADLQFIYLDPVLASHLEDQAEELYGKSLLSFVHPDEQASAKHDLGSVLESRTLHGSVTRVRFSRLSKVRRMLGYDGPPPNWSDAEKIALDKDYMAVDIVINWAADGLVLCFIHASVDLAPSDNDEIQKTDWTNWCGTPWMPQEQLQLLFNRLLVSVPQDGTMYRVFQILSNQRDRSLLMSWPPDPAQGPTSRDFAKLVENVQIESGVPGGNDAKTSCTRRYKALQGMPPVFGGEVESIFIPHGSIIFACHKVNPAPRSTSTNPTAPMQQVDYAPGYNPHQSSSYYEHASSYALPPLSTQTQAYNSNFMTQSGPGVQPSYSPRWTQGQEFSHDVLEPLVLPYPIAALPQGVSNLRSGSYAGTSPTSTSPSWTSGPPSASASYMESASSAPFNRPVSPNYNYSPTTTSSSTTTSPTTDVVPPPRRRISPGSSRDQSASTRASGNRPTGVQKCSSCKATSSPEWRKGPSGKKELCNACGLRYARSRAKKEGINPTQQRRRKEKSLVKRDSATPPTSVSVPVYQPAIRRSYPDSTFSASSAGSASGSDIYPHAGHPIVDHVTPSPSPPASASNMSFVHYAPGGSDSRPPYSSTSNNFYSVPSPLSHPHILHHHDQQQSSMSQASAASQHSAVNQLPPLGHLSSYAGRLSPMMPPGSPVSHSSLTSTYPPASYERERDRDRDLREMPPTPLSAEAPRLTNRRSILTQHISPFVPSIISSVPQYSISIRSYIHNNPPYSSWHLVVDTLVVAYIGLCLSLFVLSILLVDWRPVKFLVL
ncbi:hypothetical protein CVT26_012554 [Gymnopilus dilepis]|uniref:GATA-type domain-containing protein n=1 Tax=Gymnopilus dilepis TaxID=231916 RepID=A0A409WDB1_9AGAR|nr:hypothetical protein CVT26_012554 [Gymnopilus dilepis]